MLKCSKTQPINHDSISGPALSPGAAPKGGARGSSPTPLLPLKISITRSPTYASYSSSP